MTPNAHRRAALLQVLLRKMWDRASAATTGTRTFTRALYESCKSSDLLDLLRERLDTIAAGPGGVRGAVESGLALDLLRRLVTDQDTTVAVPAAELAASYADPGTVQRLLQQLVDHYLVVREDGLRCRLAHDTLARAVRIQYARSMLPGQRAARLLESKADDMERRPDAVDFSRADLRILDEGLAGLRRLAPHELGAIEASRRRREQEAQDLEEKNLQLQRALAGEQRQALEARGNLRNLQASQEPDLTAALRLSLEAVRLFESPAAIRTLSRAYDRAFAADVARPLRRTVASGGGRHLDVTAGETGLLFSANDPQHRLAYFDLASGTIRVLAPAGSPIRLIRCSPFSRRAIVARADSIAHLVDLETETAIDLPAPFEFEQVEFLDADHLIYHQRARLARLALATGETSVLLDLPGEELISAFAVAPDRRHILIATREKRLYRHELDTGVRQLLLEYDQIIGHLRWPEATRVVFADFRRGVRSANLETGEVTVLQDRNEEQVMSGVFLLAGNSGCLAYTRAQDADEIVVRRRDATFVLRCPPGDYFSELILAPGRQLAVTAGFRGIALWKLHRTMTTVFQGDTGTLFVKPGPSPEQYLLAREGGLRHLDLERRSQVEFALAGVTPDPRKTAIAGHLMATADGRGHCFFVDLSRRSGELVPLPFEGDVFRVYLGHGALWVTDAKGGLYAWHPDRREWRHDDFGQLIYALACGPGPRLAIGLADGSVQVASADNPGVALLRFHKLSKPLLCLEWSADGSLLFAGGWNSFGVLARADGSRVVKLQHDHWVIAAAFSPDGRQLATSSQDGKVRVFDTDTGVALRSLPLAGEPGACRFSRDGRQLFLVLDAERMVRRWALDDPAEMARTLDELAIDSLPASPDAAVAPVAAASGDLETPFAEDRPPQINLGGLRFSSADD